MLSRKDVQELTKARVRRTLRLLPWKGIFRFVHITVARGQAAIAGPCLIPDHGIEVLNEVDVPQVWGVGVQGLRVRRGLRLMV